MFSSNDDIMERAQHLHDQIDEANKFEDKLIELEKLRLLTINNAIVAIQNIMESDCGNTYSDQHHEGGGDHTGPDHDLGNGRSEDEGKPL